MKTIKKSTLIHSSMLLVVAVFIASTNFIAPVFAKSQAGKVVTGTISVQAYYNKCKTSKKKFRGAVWNANTERWQKCSLKKTKRTPVFVRSDDPKAICNNRSAYLPKGDGDGVGLGATRKLKCTQGVYRVFLASPEAYYSGNTQIDSSMQVDLKARQKVTIKLGTTRP